MQQRIEALEGEVIALTEALRLLIQHTVRDDEVWQNLETAIGNRSDNPDAGEDAVASDITRSAREELLSKVMQPVKQ